jgi:hypothetical protein
MGLVIPVLLGSVRTERQGIKAARFMMRRSSAAMRRSWSTLW